MNERIDELPTNNIDINKPVSSKLQKILGLKEWHKDRAKEGRQLEIGTDKYRQYLVDLTPGEEFKSEQNKKREQQAERVSKMISKIIANRS
jgi:regulator of replication initiation timing